MRRRDLFGSAISMSAAVMARQRVPIAPEAEGQRRRRAEIYKLHQAACGPLFNDRGEWIGPTTESTARVRFWHSLSLLSSSATRDKANAIIRRTFADRAELAPFSHFEFCAAAQILTKSRDHLSPDTEQLLVDLLREHFKRASAVRWMGYNDNFPAMENLTQCLGGDLLSDQAAKRRGVDGMMGLLEYFRRRGLLAEYSSPTYTPITLLCFADIGEYVRDPEARQLARKIENLIWLDLATHFHAPTNLLAGPHSRAYNVDSCGHLHQVHMALYQAFGSRIWLNPTRFLFPPAPKQVIHHEGDVAFMQASAVWLSSATYHPSAEVQRLVFDKPLPFRVSASTEHGTATATVMNWDEQQKKFASTGEPIEYQGGELTTTTYLTRDYAVGSATVQFHDGNQTDTFFVNFRRSAQPKSLEDISTIFSRYTVNDDAPGRPWVDPRNPSGPGSHDLLADGGRVRAIQKDGTVLALYQAKSQFLQDYKALRLTIVVPEFYRKIRRVTIGNGDDQHSAVPDIVWIEDEFCYAAFRPLIPTNHGRMDAIRIERENGYLAIQFVNYEGPPRRFTRKELLETLNGFVAEIGSRSEYGSFEAFRKRILSGEVDDKCWAGHRITRYRRPGVQLDIRHTLCYSAVTYMLIDGKPMPRPIFSATGVTWPHGRV